LSAYKVKLAKKASKQIEGLPVQIQERVLNALRIIQSNPHRAKQLHGMFAGAYRYRVGNYRIVFRILESERAILIANVLHRGRAYRRQ